MFETTYLGNVINLLKLKVAQKSLLFWATSSFQKITMSLQKYPNWQKITQSGHPERQ